MLNKNYIFFLASTFLFVTSVVFLLTIYANWYKPISPEENGVEVNLPIINLEKYMQLSKKLNQVE